MSASHLHETAAAVAHWDLPLGRMRSRTVGSPQPGTPEVVLLQGMAVSDYLLPGLGALGRWTRAHLVDLPGLAGSGEPPRELDVAEYGQAAADWVRVAQIERCILVGHSSSTQVAGHAASRGPSPVVGVALASPTFDPAIRTMPRALLRWQLNALREPGDIAECHRPEWRRAGARRLLHLLRAHLADRLEDQVPRLGMPVLVLRASRDPLLGRGWAVELSRSAPSGWFAEMPGAHSFPWTHPAAWSRPVRRLALDAARA